MIAGGIATMVGFLLLPVAKLIALIPYASLWWTVFVVEKLARIPYGSLEVSTFGRLISGLYYLAFGAGFLWWIIRQEQRATTLIPEGWRPFLLRSSAMAALLILPLWTGATYVESQPDGRLHLQLLGREQGAAFLIITPGGNRILLDPARESPVYPLDSILRSLPGGNQSLDLHILTRPDVDAFNLKADNSLLPTDLQAGMTINLDKCRDFNTPACAPVSKRFLAVFTSISGIHHLAALREHAGNPACCARPAS